MQMPASIPFSCSKCLSGGYRCTARVHRCYWMRIPPPRRPAGLKGQCLHHPCSRAGHGVYIPMCLRELCVSMVYMYLHVGICMSCTSPRMPSVCVRAGFPTRGLAWRPRLPWWTCPAPPSVAAPPAHHVRACGRLPRSDAPTYAPCTLRRRPLAARWWQRPAFVAMHPWSLDRARVLQQAGVDDDERTGLLSYYR